MSGKYARKAENATIWMKKAEEDKKATLEELESICGYCCLQEIKDVQTEVSSIEIVAQHFSNF